jgi:hypothetical protein
MAVVFDNEKFYRVLNSRRGSRKLSWNKVALRAGVTPTSMSAFVRQYEEPESQMRKSLTVDNVVRLMHWMGATDISEFYLQT